MDHIDNLINKEKLLRNSVVMLLKELSDIHTDIRQEILKQEREYRTDRIYRDVRTAGLSILIKIDREIRNIKNAINILGSFKMPQYKMPSLPEKAKDKNKRT